MNAFRLARSPRRGAPRIAVIVTALLRGIDSISVPGSVPTTCEEVPLSVTDEYLVNNERYASTFKGPLPMPPSAQVAVVACMDARMDVYRILGLGEGEAHVIRNAGGVITDDEIRSLAISQRLLGTKDIILIHHTDCGMLTFTDDEFKRAIQDDTGIKPEWAAEAFPDLEEDVRQSLRRIETSPFVTKHESLRGFIFDVATGKLNEVALSG
jgi:carbonic anhydrase